MGIPTLELSTITEIGDYATNTSSTLSITSVLFDNHTIHFPAFLTDMSQTFTSTWNTENVFGRNDPIGIFQGTVRTISLAFTLVSPTSAEANLNLRKLDVLTSFLYPAYKIMPGTAFAGSESTFSESSIAAATSHMYGSPLVRVKFANLINNNLGGGNEGALGWIGGLNINPSMDAGTFHEGGKHFPKIIEISFDLNVLHEKTPGYNEAGGWQGDLYPFGSKGESGIEGLKRIVEQRLAVYKAIGETVVDKLEEGYDKGKELLKGFLGGDD